MQQFAHPAVRPARTLVVAAFFGVLVAAQACGGGGSAQSPDAPIGINTTQLAVTVENRTGAPLVDVTVSVIGSLTFSRTVPRLENAQPLQLPIDDFTSPDGTHLNLRAANPKTVRVTGTDLSGKAYNVEADWR